jgi:hypothetical protein
MKGQGEAVDPKLNIDGKRIERKGDALHRHRLSEDS